MTKISVHYRLKADALPVDAHGIECSSPVHLNVDTNSPTHGSAVFETITGNSTEEYMEYVDIEYLDESMEESTYEDIEFLDNSTEEMEVDNCHEIKATAIDGLISSNESLMEPLMQYATDMDLCVDNSYANASLEEMEEIPAALKLYDSPEKESTRYSVQYSDDNPVLSVRLDDDTFTASDTIITVNYHALFKEQKTINSQLRESNKDLKQALRKSNRKSAWRLKSSLNIRKKYHSLERRLKRLVNKRSNDTNLANLVRKNPVLHNSLLNSIRKPKGRRYHDKSKKFALGSYLAGPAAYRFVQRSNLFVLPSKMSIHRWNSDVHMKPGLNEAILKRLSAKSGTLSKKDRVVSICLDGMSVKPELSYNAKRDIFVGFPDYGKPTKFENNNPLVLATEAVAIMISGITSFDKHHMDALDDSKKLNKRFKQVILQYTT